MEDLKRKYTFDEFKETMERMSRVIPTTDNSYVDSTWANPRDAKKRKRQYSKEEVRRIIESGSSEKQQELSYYYFVNNGFYRRIITYYATLLKYVGLLIPSPTKNADLSKDFVQKRYNNAIDFIDRANLPGFFTNCALRALRDGTYYGVIITLNKKTFAVLDLPSQYCISRFKNQFGEDIIEFDVRYFNSITNTNGARDKALAAYPEVIRNYYYEWSNSKTTVSPYVIVPSDIGICFPMFDDGVPTFLNVIPATMDYEEAISNLKEKDEEEIKKIIVQKIPHLNDGTLLFEPIEAEEIHRGTVNMMKKNSNVSVLTTYADVDSIVSKSTDDNSNASAEATLKKIYSEAGASSQLFATEGNLSLSVSIQNDVAFMMVLAHKFENFITKLINRLFGNSNINFTYRILPISYYNEKDYIDGGFKLATSGYSFLIPALAMGLSQKELGDLKDLENQVLDLRNKLIPLQSSYTESNNSGDTNGDGQSQVGAPKKNDIELSPKTLQNEESLDRQ